MVKHFCDKCGSELSSESQFKREIAGEVYYDLCDDCNEMLLRVVDNFVSTDWNEVAPKPEAKTFSCWHDMKLGFPAVQGTYLVTIRFDDGTISRRIAKFRGDPCWYKMGRSFGLIDEEGAEVIAWTDLPEPYEAG